MCVCARVRLRFFMCKDVGTEVMHVMSLCRSKASCHYVEVKRVMALSKACCAAVFVQGSRQTLSYQEGFRSVPVPVSVSVSVSASVSTRARVRLHGVVRAVCK